MSRFSFSSSLSLFQSVTVTDSDATSSSTSSNSAINNSSGSLSLSPQSSSSATTPATCAPNTSTTPNNSNNNNINHSIAALLFERQAREPSKYANNIKQLNKVSNHLLELQREIKEEEEEIFADINSLINNRSNLYSSFDDDTDDLEDTLGGITNITANTTTCTHPFSASNNYNNNNNNNNSRKNKIQQQSDYFHEDEDQGLGQETDLLGDENVTTRQHHQYVDESKTSANINSSNLNNHDHFNGEDYVLCNRVSGQQQQHLEEPSEQEHQGQQQQQQHYLELVHGDEDKHHHLYEQQQQHRHKDDDQQDQQQQQQLEEEQQQQLLDDYQAIQREDILQLTNNLPKPCVFFLEGNCRRSDCKYSHDLSSITCKYWIEGFCFKGDMCPFLHSFNQKGQVSSLLDDELALTRERLNPTFTIESESDFPSLPLDAPIGVSLGAGSTKEIEVDSLNIENQILSSNPAVVFKTTKKKRKKG